MTDKELSDVISSELDIRSDRVKNVIALLDEGATVPFIARYRKEKTGSLDEIAIRKISLRVEALRNLDKRKETVIAAIEAAGKMTPELKRDIEQCVDANRLEDMYLPYKPKRKTRASVARERGLEPLARIIMSQRCDDVASASGRFLKDGVDSVDEALAGASDIIAEWISERPALRRQTRNSLFRRATIHSKGNVAGTKYADYDNFSRPLSRIPAHAFLALQRAEKEGLLKVSVEPDEQYDVENIERNVIRNSCPSESGRIIRKAAVDSYKRLLLPSITNEALAEIKDRSDRVSIDLFSEGLRQVLLYPPIRPTGVLAIDPGFRTGCKVVCLSSDGDLLCHDVIYPVEPHLKVNEAAAKVKSLIRKFGCGVIALGDGTASRETEEFLNSIDFPEGMKIERVSEQGASIYSASEIAIKEFPDLDLTFRSAVSIGRRLLDPLAELVKIDPKSIGVGQYQHDVNQTLLRDALKFTVERCVNDVGVNVNTASAELLGYVSGIGPTLAENIIAYRNANGCFSSRQELKKVPRLGAKAFEQCSGFLRIPGAANPLDNSSVHPESYRVAEKMAKSLGCGVKEIIGNEALISRINPDEFVDGDTGIETVNDILKELKKPGRDPRQPVEAEWRNTGLRTIDDVREGMVLQGKVVNLTAFGAFVDLGIKVNGLIHISQISDRRVQTPAEVLKIWQIVTVAVMSVDRERNRISLTMKGVR